MLRWVRNILRAVRRPKAKKLPHEMIYDDEFRLWAFGTKTDQIIQHQSLTNRWNRIHGEKLRIESPNHLLDAFPAMWELYVARH